MNIEYGSNSKIREVLLLHIIQTMLNNKKENSHFPFDRYKKEKWDIEHIHAIATNVKVKKEEQGEWLKNNYLESNQDNNENKNNKINDIINGKFIEDNEFSSILEYVLGDEDNNIRNLCLLDRSTNRSYKNDAFVVKRKKIIERELTGTFIPICTRNIFMKYYSKDVGDLKIWNEKDRDSYLNNIQEVINIFLTNQ